MLFIFMTNTVGVGIVIGPTSALYGSSARGGTSFGDRVDIRVRAPWFHERSHGLSSQVAPGIGRYLLDEPATTDRYTVHVIETIDLGGGSNERITAGRQWVDGTTATVLGDSSVGETHRRYDRMQSFEAIHLEG